MPTQVNVYLADLPRVYSSEDATALKVTLQNFFNQVISNRRLDATVTVSWAASNPTVGAKDLICYFVRDDIDTIVGGNVGAGRPASSNWGFTAYTGRTVGSEAYSRKPRTVAHAARLALHELMHNMSLTGDSMHRAGMSIGAETVMEDAALSDTDMAWIAQHLLATARTQWDGGWGAYNDPLRGI